MLEKTAPTAPAVNARTFQPPWKRNFPPSAYRAGTFSWVFRMRW